MILIEASTGQRLRPIHLLLMLYRYLSGIYQLGDVAALNYVKGYVDGYAPKAKLEQILTVSGHGIGEPEIWLSDRLPMANIDTVSFRLMNTQLLQFLRTAGPGGVGAIFAQFRKIVASLPSLAELVEDEGLVPYWELQAAEWSRPRRSHVNVYSDSPLNMPGARTYDLIYVSHGLPYLDTLAVSKLRGHLHLGGWLAVLVPTPGDLGSERFADSSFVSAAKRLFNDRLALRGYPPVRDSCQRIDFTNVASKTEYIRFSVPASAKNVLVGELLLYSMHEHLSDRVRLEVLAETLDGIGTTEVAVREVLELFMVEGNNDDQQARES